MYFLCAYVSLQYAQYSLVAFCGVGLPQPWRRPLPRIWAGLGLALDAKTVNFEIELFEKAKLSLMIFEQSDLRLQALGVPGPESQGPRRAPAAFQMQRNGRVIKIEDTGIAGSLLQTTWDLGGPRRKSLFLLQF